MMGTFGRRGEVLFSAVGFQLLVGVPGHVPGYPQGAPIRGLNDNLDILGHRADKLPPPVLVGRQSWVGITYGWPQIGGLYGHPVREAKTNPELGFL